MPQLTQTQLINAAGGIAYRCQQLSNVAVLHTKFHFPVFVHQATNDRAIANVVKNAFIESALTNSRALAYFLYRRPHDKDIHFSYYRGDWSDPVQKVTGVIDGVISEHLSHPSPGDRVDPKHPGQWPLGELAVVLISAVHRFVGTLDEEMAGWFTPDLAEVHRAAVTSSLLSPATPASDNLKVRKLTTDLQNYLAENQAPGGWVPNLIRNSPGEWSDAEGLEI